MLVYNSKNNKFCFYVNNKIIRPNQIYDLFFRDQRALSALQNYTMFIRHHTKGIIVEEKLEHSNSMLYSFFINKFKFVFLVNVGTIYTAKVDTSVVSGRIDLLKDEKKIFNQFIKGLNND